MWIASVHIFDNIALIIEHVHCLIVLRCEQTLPLLSESDNNHVCCESKLLHDSVRLLAGKKYKYTIDWHPLVTVVLNIQ